VGCGVPSARFHGRLPSLVGWRCTIRHCTCAIDEKDIFLFKVFPRDVFVGVCLSRFTHDSRHNAIEHLTLVDFDDTL
jgi:hypothetical protein